MSPLAAQDGSCDTPRSHYTGRSNLTGGVTCTQRDAPQLFRSDYKPQQLPSSVFRWATHQPAALLSWDFIIKEKNPTKTFLTRASLSSLIDVACPLWTAFTYVRIKSDPSTGPITSSRFLVCNEQVQEDNLVDALYYCLFIVFPQSLRVSRFR